MAEIKKKKEEQQELTKKERIVNLVMTIVQILMVVVCVTISIFVIVNPGGYRENPEDCNTDMMLVMSDSMEPTLMTNELIFGKDVPEGVLPLGTVVTFAVKTYDGYYLDTHRIVGYICSYYDENNVLSQKKMYLEKGVLEDVDDIPKGYTFFKYVTRGDKYTLQYGATLDNCAIYMHDAEGKKTDQLDTTKDDPVGLSKDEVLALWNGDKIPGVGNVLRFLQDPIAFALIILLPLVLLFGYNVFLIVKMVIADKTQKAREAALAEVAAVQIDEEEIKRRAIEEYLASLKKQEEENNGSTEE